MTAPSAPVLAPLIDPAAENAVIESDHNSIKQYLPCPVNGLLETSALIDSGNLYRSAISLTLFQKLGLSDSDLRPSTRRVGTAKQGADLKVLGELTRNLSLSVGGLETKFKFRPVVIEGLTMPISLHSSFLRFHHWDQLHAKEALLIQGRQVPLVAHSVGPVDYLSAVCPLTSPLLIDSSFQIPPHSKKVVTIHCPTWHPSQDQGIVAGSVSFMDQTDLHPV